MSCLGNCGKDVRNPPSRKITGYCSECLGLAHKTRLKVELSTEILDKLNLKEREYNLGSHVLSSKLEYKLPKCRIHKAYYKVCTSRTGHLGFYCNRCSDHFVEEIKKDINRIP